ASLPCHSTPAPPPSPSSDLSSDTHTHTHTHTLSPVLSLGLALSVSFLPSFLSPPLLSSLQQVRGCHASSRSPVASSPRHLVEAPRTAPALLPITRAPLRSPATLPLPHSLSTPPLLPPLGFSPLLSSPPLHTYSLLFTGRFH